VCTWAGWLALDFLHVAVRCIFRVAPYRGLDLDGREWGEFRYLTTFDLCLPGSVCGNPLVCRSYVLKCVENCFCITVTSQPHEENEVALQRAEMRMVRWMCNVKVKNRVPSKELRERLGIDDIILILQQNRLWRYGHVLWKEDTDWVKKCMEYEVEGSRPRGRPKRTWKEVVQKDCQPRSLNREDAMDRSRWKKLIKIGCWSGWWVGECFFWYRVVPDKGS